MPMFFVGLFPDELQPVESGSELSAAQEFADSNSVVPGERFFVGTRFVPYQFHVDVDVVLDDLDQMATDGSWPETVEVRTFGERVRGKLLRAMTENNEVVSAFETLVNDSLGLGAEGMVEDVLEYEVMSSYTVRRCST